MAKASDAAAFRARALAKLRGEAAPAPALTGKRARNKVRNDQRQRAVTPWRWKRILADWDHACAYCGAHGPDVTLEKEHYLPLTAGGTLEADNVIPACRRCNRKKGNMWPRGFVAMMGWSADVNERIEAYLRKQEKRGVKHLG